MVSRRKFIRNSLYSAAGAGFVSKYGTLTEQNTLSNDSKLVYRKLGKTGIELPIVSMGSGNTSSFALVRTALDKGVKLIATAAAYGGGNNEKMVGTAIRGLPRDSFMIMTNSFDIKWLDTQTGILNSAFNHDFFIQSVKGTLSRLGVDYVDIFMQPFAAKRESIIYEPALRSMETIKKEGLTRFIGIATHRSEPEAINTAVEAGIYDVVMTSYNFLKTNREELDEAIRSAAKAGLGIVAMKTMAGAYWDKEKTRPINTRAALKWVLQNENISTTVPDCSNVDQLMQDIEVMSDLNLTEEELQDLKPPSEGLTSGIYCQQCGNCLSQCPNGVDIPSYMRSYMYAYGHHNLPHAKYTLASAGLKKDPCSGCTTCDVKCRMGFNIREKIRDISGIFDIPQDFLHV